MKFLTLIVERLRLKLDANINTRSTLSGPVGLDFKYSHISSNIDSFTTLRSLIYSQSNAVAEGLVTFKPFHIKLVLNVCGDDVH